MAGAAEFRAFEVTCPPGVPESAPQVTDLVMPVRTVLKVRVRVPPGPLSSMGFGIGSTDTVIIPFDSDVLIVADDETFEWELENQIDSGSWQAFMYNTGQYPHTIYIYFTVELPDSQAAPAAQPLPAEGISSVSSSSSTVTAQVPALAPLVLAS